MYDLIVVCVLPRGCFEQSIRGDEQRRDEGDNRAYRLSLSARGEALYREIVPLALAWEGRLLDALDASLAGMAAAMEDLYRELLGEPAREKEDR